jgi:hypothetical protein
MDWDDGHSVMRRQQPPRISPGASRGSLLFTVVGVGVRVNEHKDVIRISYLFTVVIHPWMNEFGLVLDDGEDREPSGLLSFQRNFSGGRRRSLWLPRPGLLLREECRQNPAVWQIGEPRVWSISLRTLECGTALIP